MQNYKKVFGLNNGMEKLIFALGCFFLFLSFVVSANAATTYCDASGNLWTNTSIYTSSGVAKINVPEKCDFGCVNVSSGAGAYCSPAPFWGNLIYFIVIVVVLFVAVALYKRG